MDAYVDGAALHALIAGKRPGQTAPEVVYLRSEDGGSSWSPAIALAGTAAGAVTGRRGNDVQVAAAGDHLVAAWRVEGAFPGTGRIVTAFSDDGGRTWHMGSNPAGGDNGLDQGYMDLAADRLDHFHLVWLDDREETGRYQGLRYARSSDGGRHWTGHQTIDAATCTAAGPP